MKQRVRDRRKRGVRERERDRGRQKKRMLKREKNAPSKLMQRQCSISP